MLYVEGEGTFEFERTASRLREMQDQRIGGNRGLCPRRALRDSPGIFLAR